MKTELFGGKIRIKIGFLGGGKETLEVGREIFLDVFIFLEMRILWPTFLPKFICTAEWRCD
jgi:hypothetical protein